ncbi:MAG: ABC transporter ATP-binding protein [Thermoplasmata archaeon]
MTGTGLLVEGLTAGRGPFSLGPVGFAVAPGEATAVLGPSGAGKTTLLRTIAGFHPARSGSVSLDGRPLLGEGPEHRRFGFVPPGLGLFPHRTVAANVRYPLDLAGAPDAGAEAARWIDRFDLRPLAHRYPHELSGGERQRVAMARTLAARPRALLWDEPLSAVDLAARDRLLALLRERLREEGIPLVLVTHDPPTALALATRYLLLARGRVVREGPPPAILAGPIDRFTARFFGYANCLGPGELGRWPDPAAREGLLARAGPGGLAVPAAAIGWRPVPGGPARIAAIRWDPAGWTVLLALGGGTLHATAPEPPPPVGTAVAITVDPSRAVPLGGEERGAP